MKNYYEILEVSKKASTEVIDKAYRVLAKKYHPDLQEEAKKEWAEEQFKIVSEAYEILSDPIKRENYDKELQEEEQRQKQEEKIVNPITEEKPEEMQYDPQQNSVQRQQEELEYQRIIQQQIMQQQQRQAELEMERQRAYHNAYIKSLKDMGYRIRYKKTGKDYLAFALTIAILIIIAIVIWHIPITHDYLVNLYESNRAIQFIVDTIGSIFHSIGNMLGAK